MAKLPKDKWMLIILLVIGSLFGTLIGELLRDFLPFLYYGEAVGLSPTEIDLSVITITLGMTLKLNVATIIGFFIALFIYSRL